MALAHTFGFPSIGRDRELKKALDAYWQGRLDEAGLRAVGRSLRTAHWQTQQDVGIGLLPVGDFAWYDQVLAHSLLSGRCDSLTLPPGRWANHPGHSGCHGARRRAWLC